MFSVFNDLFLFCNVILSLQLFCLVNQGRTRGGGGGGGGGLADRKLVKAPSSCIAGSLKAALLFWFFGDFRCGRGVGRGVGGGGSGPQ